MFFGKKKVEEKIHQVDVGQKFFKYAAFIFLAFVLYEIYSTDLKTRISDSQEAKHDTEVPSGVTQAQIDSKVQEAFDKMYQNPEYKKIKDFISYIEDNVDKQKGTALKTPEGYLLFIPFDLVFKDNSVPDNKILVPSEEVEFYIDYKIVQKILENPSVQDQAQAIKSNIGEIKTDIDNAEYNKLMEEIAQKNGAIYTTPAKVRSVPEEKAVPKPTKKPEVVKIKKEISKKPSTNDVVKPHSAEPSKSVVNP